MYTVFKHIKNAAFKLIFSDLCCFCKSEPRRRFSKLCGHCRDRLKFIDEPFCTICGKPFFTMEDDSHKCGECIKNKRHYDKARSVFFYDDIVRNKIIEYKFLRNLTLGKIFSEYVYDYITLELNGEYDTIIPVPLHKKRLRERYFNQALFLIDEEMFSKYTRNQGKVKSMSISGQNLESARHAPVSQGGHRTLGLRKSTLRKRDSALLPRNHLDGQITVDKYSLKRIKYTTPQVRLNNQERVKNVKGAFSVENDYNIVDKRVLLVDDIYTTGSTVNECALVLKNAGAVSVDVLTLAKTIV